MSDQPERFWYPLAATTVSARRLVPLLLLSNWHRRRARAFRFSGHIRHYGRPLALIQERAEATASQEARRE